MPNVETIVQMELNELEYAENYDQENLDKGKYALANDFVRMPKAMSIQLLKMLGAVLSKIDSKNDNRNEFGELEVTMDLRELMKLTGANLSNYEYYRDLVDDFQVKTHIKATLGNDDISGNVISYAVVENKTNVKFTVLRQFIPFVQELKNNFTMIEIANTINFTSRFSYNLYINLLSWRKLNQEGYRFYTTRQLKEVFGLSVDDYVRSSGKFDRSAFEKKTIVKAVQEINDLTNMRIAWKKNYKGNKVANYQFNFVEFNEDIL